MPFLYVVLDSGGTLPDGREEFAGWIVEERKADPTDSCFIRLLLFLLLSKYLKWQFRKADEFLIVIKHPVLSSI